MISLHARPGRESLRRDNSEPSGRDDQEFSVEQERTQEQHECSAEVTEPDESEEQWDSPSFKQDMLEMFPELPAAGEEGREGAGKRREKEEDRPQPHRFNC